MVPCLKPVHGRKATALLIGCAVDAAAPCCRHPASGYVQGMNDLVTPFVAVFLSEVLPGQIHTWTTDTLTEVGQGTAARGVRVCPLLNRIRP